MRPPVALRSRNPSPRARRRSVLIAFALTLAGAYGVAGQATWPGELRDAPRAFVPPPLSPIGAALTPVELGDGVWVLRGDRGAVDNVGVVVGESHVLLIDSHATPRMAGLVRQAVEAITEKPIRFIVNTNRHGDHVFGNASFPEAVVISHEGQRLDAAGVQEERDILSSFIGEAGFFDDVEYRGPDITVVDSMTIDLGTHRVVVEHVGSLNAPGDIVVRVEREGILFSGNLLTQAIVPLLWGGTALDWVDFVDRVSALGPRLIVPGHLAPVEPTALPRMRAYGVWLDSAVRAELSDGRTPKDIGDALTLPDDFVPPGSAPFERIVRGFHALNALRTAQALSSSR